MWYLKIAVESFSDSESDTLDTDTKTRENLPKPVHCDYWLCDYQNILFKPISNLKAHLIIKMELITQDKIICRQL